MQKDLQKFIYRYIKTFGFPSLGFYHPLGERVDVQNDKTNLFVRGNRIYNNSMFSTYLRYLSRFRYFQYPQKFTRQ